MVVLPREHTPAGLRRACFPCGSLLFFSSLSLLPHGTLSLTAALKKAAKKAAAGPITQKPDFDSWRKGSILPPGVTISSPAPAGPTDEPVAKWIPAGSVDHVERTLRKASTPKIRADKLLKRLAETANATRGYGHSESFSGMCKKRINQPHTDFDCPSECPYIRPDTEHFCAFACVAKEDCDNHNPLTSFADPETLTCSLCEVPGCDLCGNSKDECARCQTGMDLVGTKCISQSTAGWHRAYIAIGVVVTFLLIYVIELWARPQVNEEGYQRGLEYRHKSKLEESYRDRNGRVLLRPLPLFTNLAKKNVSGVGVQLFFSWQQYIILWAIGMVIALVVLAIVLAKVPGLVAVVDKDYQLGDPDAVEQCVKKGKRNEEEARLSDIVFLYFTVGVYVVSTIGSLALVARHRLKAVEMDTGADTMMDYGVKFTGLPARSGGSDLEEEYKRILQKAWPDLQIVGVSLSWDHGTFDLDLNQVIKLHLARLEKDRKLNLEASGGEFLLPQGSREFPPQVQSSFRTFSVNPISPRRPTCDLQCRFIDSVLLGTIGQKQEENFSLNPEKIASSLAKVQATGSGFIIFRTEVDRNKALQKPPLTIDGSTLQLKPTTYEPEAVIWENHFSTRNYRFLRFLGSLVMLAVSIFLWVQFFYAPYAEYILSWSGVTGHGTMGIQGTLLGLVITLGNQIMYYLCAYLADRVYFKLQSSRDLAYVSMYTLAVFINTILDLLMVLVQAKGYKSSKTWQLALSAGASSSGPLGAKAIAQNPSIQDSVYLELVAYLCPGTLLVPYLLEPLMMWLVPWYLFKWLIRSRPSISAFDAEDYMLGFPFDLCRYGDIIICVSVCVLVFFVASSQMWIVFLHLLAMLLFVYVWDHCRLIRIAPRSFSDQTMLDSLGLLMLAFPTALLASCVMFRMYGVNVEELAAFSVQTEMCMAFWVHIVVYCSIFFVLDFCIKKRKGEPELGSPYEKACEGIPCNWFNANYIHCLRTKYIYQRGDGEKWCIPFRNGREILLEPSPENGCYYKLKAKRLAEEEWFEKDREAIQEMVSGSRHAAKRFLHMETHIDQDQQGPARAG